MILPKKFTLFLVVFSALSSPRLQAQNQTSTFGKEFRLTLLENYGNLERVSFVVSLTKLSDTVLITAGPTFKFPVYKNKDTVITFTKTTVPNAAQFGPNRSLLVKTTSGKPFALYVMNNAINSSDISAIIPSEQLPGNPEYYVNTYRGDESLGKANNSLFSVLAVDDSCMINILPSCDSKNYLYKDTLFTILLRKGQLYVDQAMDSQSFAGTKIWNTNGCKRFSVFEGAKCSYVDYKTVTCRGCDHLYNQTRPVQYLGKSFTTVPYAGQSGGYVYQVVATENNTAVSVNGTPLPAMNEGDVYTGNQMSNTALCITSDKPVSVVELMKGGECNGQNNNLGNPSLMSVLPDDQLSSKAGLSFPNTSNISQNPSFPAEYYVAIACPTGTLKNVRINGLQIDTTQFTRTCGMSVGNVKLNPALTYQLSSSSGFLAYMYAFGKDESYATEIGSGFENIRSNLYMEANKTSTCDTFHMFRFTAKADSVANFRWDFGDGTSGNGSSVDKAYNKVGKFKVKLTVDYPNNKGCLVDTFSRLITVFEKPYFSLGPDTNVCNGTFFKLAPLTRPRAGYLWSNGTNASFVTVNASQRAWLQVTDSNQCQYSDTVLVKFFNCDTNSIVIPNVFTPNTVGDYINDAFETKFTGFDLVKGSIFDRWGVLVYDFDFPNTPYWNGCLKNDLSSPCADGTYFYIFEFINTSTNFSKSVNGTVRLIR